MRVLGVQPKDVCVAIELSRTHIRHIVEYLSVCVADPDKSQYENFDDAQKFIEEDFFPGLDKLLEDIENEFGPDSA